MYDTHPLPLALADRCLYGCSEATSRPGSRRAIRCQALILGVIGFAPSSLGAIVAITMMDVGPSWYPIVLALTALPCAWVGDALHGPR